MSAIYEELSDRLAGSCSSDRKDWARRLVSEELNLEPFLSLLDGDTGTAQRFMWLLGDVCELAPSRMVPVLPLLFSFRNEMPFPGMRRSVSKWLRLTGVPESIERLAIPQLLEWAGDETVSIACRSFSTHALVELVAAGRIQKSKATAAISTQLDKGTPAFQHRMQAALTKLNNLPPR